MSKEGRASMGHDSSQSILKESGVGISDLTVSAIAAMNHVDAAFLYSFGTPGHGKGPYDGSGCKRKHNVVGCDAKAGSINENDVSDSSSNLHCFDKCEYTKTAGPGVAAALKQHNKT